MRKDKLNQELMVGDEVTVLDVDMSHGTLNTPERFKDYVVVGVKHRNPENWESPDIDTKYYVVYPIGGYSDEEATGRMLSGGGRIREEHLYPSWDSWMLKKGFLRGEGLNESIPKPGSSSAEGIKDETLPYETKYLTLDEILTTVKSIPYYNEVLMDLKDDKDDWAVTKTVKRYADYWMKNPESLTSDEFPPIQVIGDGLKDGAHRISTLNALAKHIDSDNPYWENVKLEVRFYKPEIVKDIGPTWVNGELVYNTDEGLQSKSINEHNQPGLSPDLNKGDIIRVIDIDGEHANMPDIWGVYKVHGISQDNATQEFYYQLSGETAEVIQDRLMNAKYLYHGDTWIPADMPMANKVDRKTITEHKESNLNPELKIGDEIIVLDVGVEVKNDMNKPDKYIRYFVTKIYGGNKWQEFDQPYYGLNRPDVDVTDPERPGVYDQSSTHKHLYPRADTWMFNPKGPTMRYEDAFQPEVYMSDEEYEELYGDWADDPDDYLEEQVESELNPELEIDDVIRIVDIDREIESNTIKYNIPSPELRPEMLTPYAVVDKESNGSASKYPFRYTLVPEDKLEDYEKNLDRGYGDYETYEKLLFPWVHQWIYAHKNTIEEQVDGKEDGAERLYKNHAHDNEDYVDNSPFTPLEIRILNTLHKYLDRSELQKLSQETPESYGEPSKKFWDIMKIFGITPSNPEQDTRASKYAKWALDNWTEDGDYGSIEAPIKERLKWYQVDREESGSQVEYKDGTTEVLGFTDEDAGERANYDFYSWGGEMETTDYGDYESYDSSITGTEFLRVDEQLTPKMKEELLGPQKVQDLLFNFWKKVGPTLEPDKLKLIGFNMNDNQDIRLVMMNLVEYYGDEELVRVMTERLEGLQGWEYEYKVINIDIRSFNTYPIEVMVDVMVNGDHKVPVTTADDGIIDITLWDANEKAREEWQSGGPGPYDNLYEEVREVVLSDINILLENLPVDPMLDYVDFSEPGSFDEYDQPIELITEDEGYIDDMVYIDEPREKHIRRMDRGLGSLVGFPLDKWKNMPPPQNESDTTEEEIEYLEDIPVDKKLVDSADEIVKHFTKFLTTKKLEYPQQELKELMIGVKSIILILKYHYNRPRPFQIAQAKGLELNSETLESSSSPSYPSGHATQGRFVARYLSDLYPEYREELMQIGEDIAYSRNMAKVHYPSDSTFGKLLGDEMYDFINKKGINEQLVVDKGDMLKADIFKMLSNTFILTPTDYSEIKDTEGNFYDIYDTNSQQYVNMSELLQGMVDFISHGVKSGEFKESDIQKAITAITDWVSLAMNQKKDLVN